MFSGVSERLNGFSFTSAVAYMGAKQGMEMAYLYGPTLIRAAVIRAAQYQFGFYAGYVIGHVLAQAAITEEMPKLVERAKVAGACLALASLNRIASVYNYAVNAKASRNFQNECRAIAPSCEKSLVTNSLAGDQDFEEVTMAPRARAAAAAA